MVRPEHRNFYVGGWRVSLGNDTVSRDGRRAHLTPLAMQVLVYLASRPGEVVSRSDLKQAVGHGGTVGNESLTGAVTELREALDDDARNPRYIVTVPKNAYRLVAPVWADHVAQAAAAKAESTALRRVVALSDRAKVAVLLLILAAVAALAWALLAQLTSPAASTTDRVNPLGDQRKSGTINPMFFDRH